MASESKHKGSKLGFLGWAIISVQFLIDIVPSCQSFDFWYFVINLAQATGPSENQDPFKNQDLSKKCSWSKIGSVELELGGNKESAP
jgi:hypothetical protein